MDFAYNDARFNLAKPASGIRLPLNKAGYNLQSVSKDTSVRLLRVSKTKSITVRASMAPPPIWTVWAVNMLTQRGGLLLQCLLLLPTSYCPNGWCKSHMEVAHCYCNKLLRKTHTPSPGGIRSSDQWSYGRGWREGWWWHQERSLHMWTACPGKKERHERLSQAIWIRPATKLTSCL